MTDVESSIEQIVTRLKTGNGGEIGVAATHFPTGESLRYNADEIFPTASVIKIAIVAELYTQAAQGRISLDQLVTVNADDIVGGSGVLCNLTPGLVLPLRDLAMLTISVSDNTGSNLCLRAVGGPGVVNQSIRERWGLTRTVIHRPIKFDLGPDDPPFTATGSTADMCHLLTLLHDGEIHDRQTSDAILALMREVHDNELVPRYLEVNPYADDLRNARPPFIVAHKTGASTGIRNDAALITRGAETLAICVYTKEVRDDRWTSANAASCAVADVGRAAIAHFFRR